MKTARKVSIMVAGNSARIWTRYILDIIAHQLVRLTWQTCEGHWREFPCHFYCISTKIITESRLIESHCDHSSSPAFFQSSCHDEATCAAWRSIVFTLLFHTLHTSTTRDTSLCVQQFSICTAHLRANVFVLFSISVFTSLCNNREEARLYCLMSSIYHALDWTHLRAIISPVLCFHFVMSRSYSSRAGEKPSKSLSLIPWYITLCCQVGNI